MLKQLLIPGLLFLYAAAANGQALQQEANLKAVFIYNFTKYIDWDSAGIDSKFIDGSDNEFIIGVIGPSPVTASLQVLTRTNTVKNRKISLRVFSKPEDIVFCHLLFIPQNLPFSLRSILDHAGRGVLTVSEEKGYAKQGTAFNFVVVNDKLKFEANLKVIYLSGLKAGSQLLKLAIIVD